MTMPQWAQNIVRCANDALSGAYDTVSQALRVRVPNSAIVTVEKTRPNDTTAYLANDVVSESTTVGTVWTFANLVAANGKSGYIVLAKALYTEKDTPRLRLHLYSAIPSCQRNDNSPSTSPRAVDRSWWLGTIDFDSLGDGSATGVGHASDTVQSIRDDLRYYVKFGSDSRSLVGVVETLDAFTPAANQILSITLGVEQID